MSASKTAKTIFDKQQESLKQLEKFKEEQERVAEQIAEVKNKTHQLFGEFLIKKAEDGDTTSRQLLKEFLSSNAKTKDKDVKAYLDILNQSVQQNTNTTV